MKIGIYPGSFNPFTIGHEDVINQAEQLFDKVIIAKLVNFSKVSDIDYEYLSTGTKFANSHTIVKFHGLLIDFIASLKKKDISLGYFNKTYTLIRGIRNGHDLEYELKMTKTNDALAGEIIPVVFFRCNPNIDYVSSTMVRELIKHNEEKAKQYIPK